MGGDQIRAQYQSFLRRKRLTLLILLLLLLAVVVGSIAVGSSNLSIRQVLQALVGRADRQAAAIVRNVRLPRVLAAVAVGAALALAGCVMQNVLRNPLASASTLGVSQGASFGAAFAIICLDAGIQNAAGTAVAVTIVNPYLVTLCAFVGGVLTVAVLLGLARLRRLTPASMVLSGVALSALFSGGTTLLQYFADDVKVASVVYWTFGDLGRASYREIGLVAVLTALAFLYFFCNRWNYNALESGAQTAKSLGVRVDGLQLVSMAACALLSAVAVAFVGIISFIGLIGPHIARRFVGGDYRFLLPASALLGAVALLCGDLLARLAVQPAILPIGAVTSFLGAPLFLYLVFKKGNLT